MNILSWRRKNASSNTLINEHPKNVMFKNDENLIQNLGENLEQNPRIIEFQFGKSFKLRGRLLSSLSGLNLIGIGPPDMVHVTKFDKFRQVETGEYHYLTGLDTSSEVMPIAYLNILGLNDGSQASLASGSTPSKSGHRVTTYCTANVFSNVDVRIRYESPKHFQLTVTDFLSGSSKSTMTPELWEETFVSGFVRAVITNTDKERKLPGLVEFPIALENGLAYSEKCVSLLCKFLPRGPELGCDLTKHGFASFKNNYLVASLLTFLQVAGKLNMFVVELLHKLCESDPKNEVCYRTALVAVMMNSEAHDSMAIKTISNSMQKLFPDGLSRLEQDQLAYAGDFLNLQVDFLMSKNDFQLALPLVQKTTAICSDNFEAWSKLAQCYIKLQDYKSAMFAINSLPPLLSSDPCKDAMWKEASEDRYYVKPLCSRPGSRLQSNEYNFISTTLKAIKDHDLSSMIYGRIVMPPQANRGCIKEIWDGPCMSLGPIYGPQSKNLINFVSTQEVASLEDSDLLQRNTMANQLSWSLSIAYDLLMNIVSDIGWNSLLELRSKIFVMERERTTDYTGTLQPEFKTKRLCEKWLDQLFLNLYEDLKITCNVEEHREEMYSGLEWELLGLAHLRTWNWADAVPCLRTSIMARFDVVSAEKLLDLYLTRQYPVSNVLDPDVLLSLIVEKISYESRFYNYLQLPNLHVLTRLCSLSGVENVRNHIYALPSAQRGIVALMDKLLDYIQELNDK
ncbi:LANO_0D08570g1_1 [Lachancea nothofagi CBS 11611]|uniref:LANO_0D08570g1_1 n=1 Tax=Lachancea nothofagi CBS 11611 TaxID=1266666 RepID=A0A1G4JJL8_9SACH|nr:LANO_0D08570g1_1 [Lachancea nothofagi CBS 11611]